MADDLISRVQAEIESRFLFGSGLNQATAQMKITNVVDDGPRLRVVRVRSYVAHAYRMLRGEEAWQWIVSAAGAGYWQEAFEELDELEQSVEWAGILWP